MILIYQIIEEHKCHPLVLFKSEIKDAFMRRRIKEDVVKCQK